uniref:DC1 domain-containing protein n=1 Tax=Oryza brachyantha TaxID=4533 RepID=J3MSV0_ORYBR
MTKLFKEGPATISSHPTHRQGHKLKLVNTAGEMFQCDGCMERGHGPRYRCEPCNFDLHTCCALAPEAMEHHRLFPGCRFVLLREPLAAATANARGTLCDACGDRLHARGLVYHCADRPRPPPDVRVPAGAVHRRRPPLRAPRSRPDGAAGAGRSAASSGSTGPTSTASRCTFTSRASRPCRLSRAARRTSADGEIMQVVSSPAMQGLLQSLPKRKTNGRSGLERFLTIVAGAIRVIIALIFGDPTAMIVAVAGAILNS